MTHSKFCPKDCGTPTKLQVFRDSSLEAHTALGTEEMGLQQPHSAGVRPRDGSRRGCHGSAFLWGGQLGSETQAASPPCRLSIRSTQPPISQVGLLRLRAGKAWTLTPAPPQCPQGQPPPDATGHLGWPPTLLPCPTEWSPPTLSVPCEAATSSRMSTQRAQARPSSLPPRPAGTLLFAEEAST